MEDTSIMSGDSPTSHRNEIFDFNGREGRQSPGPTTSKDLTYPPSAPGIVQASVLVEPDKEKQDEEKALCSPILNNPSPDGSYSHDPEDKTVRIDEVSRNGKDRDDRKRMNGDFDKLDGVWMPDARKKHNEEEDDNCTIKCLYYTMQCCECVIV